MVSYIYYLFLAHSPIHAWSKSNLFMVNLIYYLRVCTLAHSCLIKVQSIFSNRRRLFFTRCSSSKKSADHIHLLFLIKEKRWPHSWVIFYFWLMTSCDVPHQRKALTTFICYSVLRNLRPTCLRASSWVIFYLWLMMSSAVGLFVHARVTSLFSISSCSVRVYDDWTPVYWLSVVSVHVRAC